MRPTRPGTSAQGMRRRQHRGREQRRADRDATKRSKRLVCFILECLNGRWTPCPQRTSMAVSETNDRGTADVDRCYSLTQRRPDRCPRPRGALPCGSIRRPSTRSHDRRQSPMRLTRTCGTGACVAFLAALLAACSDRHADPVAAPQLTTSACRLKGVEIAVRCATIDGRRGPQSRDAIRRLAPHPDPRRGHPRAREQAGTRRAVRAGRRAGAVGDRRRRPGLSVVREDQSRPRPRVRRPARHGNVERPVMRGRGGVGGHGRRVRSRSRRRAGRARGTLRGTARQDGRPHAIHDDDRDAGPRRGPRTTRLSDDRSVGRLVRHACGARVRAAASRARPHDDARRRRAGLAEAAAVVRRRHACGRSSPRRGLRARGALARGCYPHLGDDVDALFAKPRHDRASSSTSRNPGRPAVASGARSPRPASRRCCARRSTSASPRALLPAAIERGRPATTSIALAALSVTIASGLDEHLALGMHCRSSAPRTSRRSPARTLEAARAEAAHSVVDGRPDPFATIYHRRSTGSSARTGRAGPRRPATSSRRPASRARTCRRCCCPAASTRRRRRPQADSVAKTLTRVHHLIAPERRPRRLDATVARPT